MKLKQLNVGGRATVTGFKTSDPAYRQKLLRMGLIRNTEITLVRKAPLGDPIEIELKGFRLILRADEADVLEVEQK